MMIGTALWARRRRQTSSPSILGSMMSSTTKVDLVLLEQLEGLLAVRSVNDPVTVAFEGEREELGHRFLVLDEENRRLLDHPD